MVVRITQHDPRQDSPVTIFYSRIKAVRIGPAMRNLSIVKQDGTILDKGGEWLELRVTKDGLEKVPPAKA